jgi:flagellin
MTSINTNINALTASNALSRNGQAQQKTMEQLSTGKRINRASDDSAGLAIRETMTAQITGLNTAIKNANDGISLLQTADGALAETSSLLQRMRELSVLTVNDTYSSAQKTAMSTEFVALASQITQIASNTQFNGMKVLDGNGGAPGGTATSVYTFQVGANNAQTMTVTIVSQALDQYALTGATLATAASAASNLTVIDTAIGNLNSQRSTIGAAVNRLSHALDNLANVAANATDSRSKIEDTDYASATSDLARQQIIAQAATAILAQANQQPQYVLSLLK